MQRDPLGPEKVLSRRRLSRQGEEKAVFATNSPNQSLWFSPRRVGQRARGIELNSVAATIIRSCRLALGHPRQIGELIHVLNVSKYCS